MHDVRNIRGRLVRVSIAILLGPIVSLAITLVLPTRPHFSGCMVSEGWLVRGGDPVLMLAGAVAASVGIYAVLDHLRRRPRLPSARLLATRGVAAPRFVVGDALR